MPKILRLDTSFPDVNNSTAYLTRLSALRQAWQSLFRVYAKHANQVSLKFFSGDFDTAREKLSVDENTAIGIRELNDEFPALTKKALAGMPDMEISGALTQPLVENVVSPDFDWGSAVCPWFDLRLIAQGRVVFYSHDNGASVLVDKGFLEGEDLPTFHTVDGEAISLLPDKLEILE